MDRVSTDYVKPSLRLGATHTYRGLLGLPVLHWGRMPTSVGGGFAYTMRLAGPFQIRMVGGVNLRTDYFGNALNVLQEMAIFGGATGIEFEAWMVRAEQSYSTVMRSMR